MMRVSNDGGAREEIRSRGVPRLVSAPVLLVLVCFQVKTFKSSLYMCTWIRYDIRVPIACAETLCSKDHRDNP